MALSSATPTDRRWSASTARRSRRRRAVDFCKSEKKQTPSNLTHSGSYTGCFDLALLWQIYSRRCLLQIHFWQCGQRWFGGWAISSRMACRTAGKVG